MPRQDLYAINVDYEKSYYNCRDFGHITKHCRERKNQRRVEQERRIEYRDNQNASNLNKKENLIVLD